MSEHPRECPCGKQLQGLQKVYCSNQCRFAYQRKHSQSTAMEQEPQQQTTQECVVYAEEPVRLPLEVARRLGRVFA